MTAQESPDQFTNTRKADFKSIYNQPNPRAYFEALTPLQYQIPQQALPFVERVLELSAAPLQGIVNGTLNGTVNGSLNGNTNRPRKVLDVCCLYGINAALLRYNLGLEGLAEHYATSSPTISSEEQIESDKLWMVTFVLRVFGFEEVAGVLEADYGLVTERVPGRLFRQRRFTSREEQSAAVADVRARGLDTAGFEEDGWFYAECYLTRPKGAVGVVEGVLGGRSRI